MAGFTSADLGLLSQFNSNIQSIFSARLALLSPVLGQANQLLSLSGL